jgi:undecaprenyl-diphosphatase
MHSTIHPGEAKASAPAAESAGAERFLLTSCLALMTLAVSLRNFDDPLLHAVYRLTHAENAAVWRGVSLLGSGLTLTPVMAAVALSLVWRGRNLSALALALGWAATSLTVEYLKWLLDRSRPPVTPWSFARGNAFPSGHAAQAAYVYLSLALGFPGFIFPAAPGRRVLRIYLGKAKWVAFLVLPAAVGYSRVALGVHWPSDVVVGWAVGLFFCALALVLRGTFPLREARVESEEPDHSGES